MSAERSQMLKPKPILTLILFPSHSTWALLFIWEYFRDIFVKLQWQQLSLCCVWFQRQAKCEAALQQMEAEEREVKVEAANSWKPHFTAAASPPPWNISHHCHLAKTEQNTKNISIAPLRVWKVSRTNLTISRLSFCPMKYGMKRSHFTTRKRANDLCFHLKVM